MRIGFVGLGNIGAPAAANLLSRGFEVQGYDLRHNSEFERAGGRQVETIDALAANNVIIQSLPSVEALELSVDALLRTARDGRILIELSSYPLEAKQRQAERLRVRGIEMLDCEISGLPAQVAARTAVIFKAGDKAAVDMATPVFDALAERHYYVGAFGAATCLKLIANMMVCVHNLMAAEALNLGARVGLDVRQMIEVLAPSAGGSTTFRSKAPLMAQRAFSEGKGPFRHMFGYLQRAAAMADSVQAATPLLDAATAIYDIARQERRHDQDIAAMIEIVESLSRHEEATHG